MSETDRALAAARSKAGQVVPDTPTVNRLIPLMVVVAANFNIAPIAINAKLGPILISRPPSSDSRIPERYRVKR